MMRSTNPTVSGAVATTSLDRSRRNSLSVVLKFTGPALYTRVVDSAGAVLVLGATLSLRHGRLPSSGLGRVLERRSATQGRIDAQSAQLVAVGLRLPRGVTTAVVWQCGDGNQMDTGLN